MSGAGQGHDVVHGLMSMKAMSVYGQEMVADDLGFTSAMEVDMDADSLDRCLADESHFCLDYKPTDADFFDAFEDDFDDADLL